MSLGRLHQLHQLGEDMGGLPSSAMVWPANDGDHWRPHSQGATALRMPSGRAGDEYAFAVRPLTRAVAARYSWTWSLANRHIEVPSHYSSAVRKHFGVSSENP